MSEITLLERLQEQVVDGDPIDWAALSLHSLTPDDAATRVRPAARTAGPRPHVVSPGRGDSDDGQRPAVDGPGGGARRGSAADVGPLRLEACVGRGGFGSVYRAWDPELEMPVAIKILHTRLHGDELKARLLHEGRALAQMRHPNVVRVLNVEQNDDRLGLVMEFPRGETLDARVAAHRLMNDRVTPIEVSGQGTGAHRKSWRGSYARSSIVVRAAGSCSVPGVMILNHKGHKPHKGGFEPPPQAARER